jgi:NOL1/NOP2/fmu family ribosome biogenesis protein
MTRIYHGLVAVERKKIREGKEKISHGGLNLGTQKKKE